MTQRAEWITVEFEEEEGVWALADYGAPLGRDDDMFTTAGFSRWYIDATRPPRGLARKLHDFTQPGPVSISSALHIATRYRVRRGLLYPAWVAFSITEAEKVKALEVPAGLRLEVTQLACYLRFDSPDPIPIARDLGLIRCGRSHDGLHYYLEGVVASFAMFDCTPDRVLAASSGVDGYL